MGALSGSMTTTAWYVEGKLPKDLKERYLAALDAQAFRDIEVEGDAEESFGWVDVSDPFDTAFALDRVFWTSYVLLGFRQDTLRVPPAVFKLHLKKALVEYLDKAGKPKASKAEVEEVRGLLERELRRRVLPSIKVHEMVWHLDRGEVWLHTSNRRACETFEALFEKTFGLQLIPRNAYALLERQGLDEDSLERAASLESTTFALPTDSRRGGS